MCYHGDVRCDRVVECPLFHVLRDKAALVLHHMQCQSLFWVSQIIHRQPTPALCAQGEKDRRAGEREDEGRRERGVSGREKGRGKKGDALYVHALYVHVYMYVQCHVTTIYIYTCWFEFGAVFKTS